MKHIRFGTLLWAALVIGTGACSDDDGMEFPDATTGDGGISDSGGFDSSEPDSGELDSGTADAGTPDTGAPDSGPVVECSGHGHLHGDHCHCDDGYEVSPDDEMACIETTDPCDIGGNILAADLPDHGSVAFVIVDGEYRFIQQPGMEDTSISFVDSTCEHAYGWSRDLPFSDDAAVETSWVLELATMTFTRITIPDTNWVVLRNGVDDGRVVGKLSTTNGTEDPSDDATRGFVHDLLTGETELVAREGFSDIGFSALNGDGVVAGFNDFGTQGFVHVDGAFEDIEHEEAFRLFPFQVNRSGMIVGFWGVSSDTWWDNSVNAGFIATRSADGMEVVRYDIEGQSGVGLTGLSEDGAIAGLAYATPSSLPVVFRAADSESAPTFYPLSGDHLEPFPTGLSESGVVYGQVYILEEPQPCGGHGMVEGDTCNCDDGYEVDPHDMMSCIVPEAECSGHGHLHGDECHCDAGYEQDPSDMMACVPS